MDMETKIDNLDIRLRIIEANNSASNETMKHLAKSLDEFVIKLEKRELLENAKYSKLTGIVYLGVGGLIVFQFLLTNGLIKIGG